jgi:class 3 adenylate cyclase
LIHANDLGVFIITFALIASIIMEVFVSQMLARDQRRVRTLMSENREQRKLAEALLCSIVPDLVARELRQGIRYTGEHQATVIFIDICGFTSRSASASPAELVASLDEFYMHVDSAAARLGIERIKFLGDGLMLACGAPHPVDQHQAVAIEFAFEVLRFVPHLKFCGSAFDIRIGAASGTVISGVVGFRRFAYDIWSPVVNLASRLESTGEPGALQISEATFAAVSSDHPLAAFFEQRQDVSAKGIGIITTYILRYRKHADALLRVRPTVLENRQKRMQAAVASLTAASVSQISPLSTSFDHYRVVRSQGTARFVAESGDDET